MRRREFIAGLGGAVAWPLAARAQQSAMPVIGFLGGGSADGAARGVAAFRQGLKDIGYVDGQNVAIEYRWANNQGARLAPLAAELVQRQVAVIVAFGGPPVLAAKAATSTIPIVFSIGGDPIKFGLVASLSRPGVVASLSRPGGNVTGMTTQQAELTKKRLGLLHELVPDATTIAFLTGAPPYAPSRDGVLAAAHRFGVNVSIFGANNDREVERAFTDMTAQALIVDAVPVAIDSSRTIICASCPFSNQVRGGGLISYSAATPSYREAAARYVAPILKGTKPSELPVQQPTKFEFVINLKTAKALGLTIPETLLATADEVIQ